MLGCGLFDFTGDVPLLGDGQEVVDYPVEHQSRWKKCEEDRENKG